MIFRNKIEIKILIDLLLTDPSFVSRLLSRKEKKKESRGVHAQQRASL